MRPDKALDTASCAAGFLFRGLSGVVVAGYTPSVVEVGEASPTTYAGSLRAAGRGLAETSTLVATWKRPVQPLILYEFQVRERPRSTTQTRQCGCKRPSVQRTPLSSSFLVDVPPSSSQGCPFCRRVREALTYFDLDHEVRPCPRDGPTWRKKVVAEFGKAQFPVLVDNNTGTSMYESADIVAYLAKEYADGVVPSALTGPLAPLLLGLSLLPRLGKGAKYRPSRANADTKPLILWSYEGSPFCILVREILTELEIPHFVKTCARGSVKREEMFAAEGRFQAPLIEDPNTGVKSFESASIIEYLEQTYAL